MKIGEFAKKHGVTVDTVRHYISEGLLTPLRENTQYNFSEIDSRVMDTILLLKGMNFKLDEMKGYLLFQTMFTSDISMPIKPFRSKFEEKLAQNQKEIKRLQQMNGLIETKLAAYDSDFSFKRGIALNRITDFTCPECEQTLELEEPKLLHNEVMEGTLRCPRCGKCYYIRYGIVSDEPIPDIDFKTEGISEMVENYIKQNDDMYVHNIREHYQKTAEIAKEHSLGAKNVMISGESAGFLNSAILRSIPDKAGLYIHFYDNATIKYFLEDLFPKETVVYSGDIEKAPFKEKMDYIFWQDYDMDIYSGKKCRLFPHTAQNARLDCLKILIYQKGTDFPDEKRFLGDLKKLGWNHVSDYKTDRIVRKQESSDLSALGLETEFETQYGIYSFKTLG